jgi:hypothetical protein
VTTTAEGIDEIHADVLAARVDTDGAIDRLAAMAQDRGGLDARRDDGAFFTDPDVAEHLARRAIVARLLDEIGVDEASVDDLLASGGDLLAVLAQACELPDARARARALLPRLVVLDPTCGAGSFLLAAWRELCAVGRLLDVTTCSLDQLHGIDLNADAVAACSLAIALAGVDAPGAPRIVQDDALAAALPSADVVLGNPPYVRATLDDAPASLATRRVPNRSAWIVERALRAAAPRARVAFVLPISTACTDAFAAARTCWDEQCDRVYTSHFDTIPASLFTGVVQRLSLFEGRRGSGAASWWTSRYHRWTRDERPGLLDTVRLVPLPGSRVGGSLAKVGTELEAELLERLFAHEPAGRWHASTDAPGNQLFYKRRWSYFLLFTDFMPGIWNEDGSEREPTECKTLDVDPALDSRVLLAAYSSTLFWWFFSVYTDNRNVNRRDLAAFPLPELDESTQARLATLADRLMVALRACAEVRTCTYRSIGTIHNTYFRQGATRPVIDEIDRVLKDAYGMDEHQLEFVLEFERRFRS